MKDGLFSFLVRVQCLEYGTFQSVNSKLYRYFYTNLWWCCFNNCLFSSSPWTDCILPAQQHHGPRPVLCDIFQVSHPNVCPASTRCVQSASPTVGMCRRRLPASSYSEWSPGADGVIGAFCFSLLSDSCFFKTVAFPSLSGMEYAEYSKCWARHFTGDSGPQRSSHEDCGFICRAAAMAAATFQSISQL